MAQHGKRYRNSRAAVDRENLYTPVEAIRLLKDSPAAKFDERIEPFRGMDDRIQARRRGDGFPFPQIFVIFGGRQFEPQ